MYDFGLVRVRMVDCMLGCEVLRTMRRVMWLVAMMAGCGAGCGALVAQDGPHGTVTGKLTGADNKPIASAWVTAIPSEGTVDVDNPEELTDDDGTFTLQVPPGKFFIVANYDWPATESAPVLTTYYPSSENEAGAKAVEVKANATAKGIDIHVTRVLTPVYIDVVVTGADGQPSTTGTAFLTQVNQAGVAGSDSGATFVDKNGHAKLLGFEGIDYLLWAENGVKAAKTCAPVMKLQKDSLPKTTVTLQLTQSQPVCGKQEDDARKAAYAMQPRLE